MRYAWIALVVILLDQAMKWLLPALPVGGVWHTGLGDLVLEVIRGSSSQQGQPSHTEASSDTSLVLLAALLGAYLFITRWTSQFHFIATKAAIGLQLTGGGLTSQLIDMLFRGSVPGTFRAHLGNSSFTLGVSDAALLAGLVLLLLALLRGSAKIEGRVTLSPAKVAPLQFNILPRGIDNIHIDVQLSPRFKKNLIRLVHNVVPLVIQQLQQGKRQITLPQRQLTAIRQEFAELLHDALHRAKVTGEKQLPDLLIIATIKLTHAEVNNCVAATLQKSKEGRKEHAIRGLKPKANDRLVSWLFRYRDHIIALSNSTLIGAICSAQKENLLKGVRNYLGLEKVFAMQAIDTPLVLSESPTNELVQLEHYPILGQQQEDENSFVNIDRQLADVFSDCLSLLESVEDSSRRELYYLQKGGDINSNTIYTLSQPSVLMNPANVTILLDTDWSQGKLKKTRKIGELRKYRKLLQHRHFQRRLREKLLQQLKKSGLSSWVVGTYEAKGLLEKSGADAPAARLTALLARKTGKAEFNQRLAEILRATSNPPAAERVTAVWCDIQKKQDELLDKHLLAFVTDFSHYRSDLLTLLIYQRAASEITLLDNKKDIDTSRANFSLYAFLHRSEEQSANAPVLSHAIIKADLRGSTEVTEKLTELDLNPATHFDRNFFSPINALIESYGAEKVFIEGDAIILILNDRGGVSQERLIAARACGLAAKRRRHQQQHHLHPLATLGADESGQRHHPARYRLESGEAEEDSQDRRAEEIPQTSPAPPFPAQTAREATATA